MVIRFLFGYIHHTKRASSKWQKAILMLLNMIVSSQNQGTHPIYTFEKCLTH